MLAQTYQNREIFVVNDASNDGTADILEEKFGRNPEIQLINLEINVGKKHALAKAIRMAKGEIFAFTDSDCIWKEDAIERIVAIFENEPDVGAISGHCNARNANTNVLTKMQDVWYERQYRFRKGFESVFRSVSCVSGPLACYRRAAIHNCVQEWENDTFLGQEFRFATDRTMTGFVLGGATLGAADRNWDVVYSRSAQAWTIVPDTPKKIMAQRIRWNKSFIRNLFFTGKFYWRQPILPALYYYIHAFYVFVAPILVMLFIAWLLFQGQFLLLAACFIAFILISTGINLVFAPNNRWQLGPVVNLLYLLTLPWLLFYSIVTIKNMEWSRENVEEG
jgi:cellulose synthase/poly-beta-1,6-N-acetylglucosamine synthase-like glycosyltransferase